MTANTPATKTILSVDDSESVRDLLHFALEAAGHRVVTAIDGQDALAKCADGPIDMVITDLNMPNIGGVELVKKLRGMPAFRGTPIVMMIGTIQSELTPEARRSGATDWLTKPFDLDQLWSLTSRLL